ncbi:ribonuclease E/G domain protein [Peptoniphilus sp. oral taxon 375 str. F0436]|nr:ribonuclease E/G domain protein [Peptoniphilus sp. oral taxon 375 str. F0436]
MEGGGLIRIEKTAALTSIDVDSSQGPDQGLTPEEINILAAKKASQQILRRDLRGMLVIDFITCDQDKKKTWKKSWQRPSEKTPRPSSTVFPPWASMNWFGREKKSKKDIAI